MKNNSIKDAKKYYSTYDVENRVKRDNAHLIEFTLSMSTIRNYINEQTRIIDVGCGTGNYSVSLASKCKEVVATDVMDNLLDILRQKIKNEKCKNITCLCTDVLEIHKSIKQKFDVVLCMGPLYHLNTIKDRNKCYNNLKKISTENAIFIFTYLTSSAYFSNFSKGRISIQKFFDSFNKESFYCSPFYFASPSIMEEELKNNSFHLLKHRALDPISSFFPDFINSFNDKQYEEFIQTLLNDSMNSKLLNFSSHNMLVAKLNKKEEDK